MPKSTVPTVMADAQAIAKQEAVKAAFVHLVNQVPDAPDGDITDLLGPILAATSWEELAATENLPSSKTLAGRELVVNTMAKKVSDKDSLTGYYLLCDAVMWGTGEAVRFTAGGEQAVAVLSQLYVLRALPAKVQFASVDVGGGNAAINCKVLDVMTSRTVDG